MRNILFSGGLAVLMLALLLLPASTQPGAACGGFFCRNVPVDQQAERIIFTMNDDDTISAYVQINYVGEAPDFSWVVPVPSVPEVDVAEMDTFDELDTLTRPVIVAPPMPECAQVVVFSAEDEADMDGVPRSGEVDVLSQGNVGPYDFAVITSTDPDALIIWLRENGYRITEEMEPLVHVYNEEGMVFLAMKLSPDQGVQDIQPVKMTYESSQPMIPLRLTAVAATPNMAVITWIFANRQAYPLNWATPTIDDRDIRVFPGGPVPVALTFTSGPPNNYLALVDQMADRHDGKAFITEFADETRALSEGVSDPLLRELVRDYDYLTRFFGRVSPEEMTVDPVFDFDATLPDVSNIRDLTKFDPEVVYGCKEPAPRR